jgi:uncharacterized delta-60 repeat protein
MKKKYGVITLLLITILGMSQTPDSTFGISGKAGPFNNGFHVAGIGGNILSVQTMAVDISGRIWIAGHKSNGANEDFAVMRLNLNGTPDASYGTGGVTKFNDLNGQFNSDEYATAIAINPADNSIILAGYRRITDNLGLNYDIVIMQLNPDGSVNNNFGQQGVRIIDDARNEEVYTIAFANGGPSGIYIGGFTNADFTDYTQARGRFWRMSNIGGSISSIAVDFGSNSRINSLVIDATGNILAAGEGTSGGNHPMAVARFFPNGSFDNSFDGDGIALIDVNGFSGVSQIKLQPDGKILLAGPYISSGGGSRDVAGVRLNTNGSLDNSFSDDGKLIVPFNYNHTISSPRSIALQANGKIVLSGATDNPNGTDSDFGVARVNADGTIDNSFGNSGLYRFDLENNSEDFANALFLQNDGKLLVGTTVSTDNFNTSPIAGLLRVVFGSSIVCSVSGADALCSGTTSTYDGPAGADIYSWTISGNGVLNNPVNQSSVSVTAGNPGAGSFTLSLTITQNGSSSTCSKTVNVNALPTCAVTGPSSVNTGSTGNSYTAPTGMNSNNWNITGNGTIVGSTTGQSVSVTAGTSGSFTLSLMVVGLNGCSNTCTLPVTVSTFSACTYTQDVYSKKNNKGCQNGTLVGVTQIMNNAFGNTNLKVFGNVANRRFFTLFRSDINGGDIFKMLPGFDGSQAIDVDIVSPFDGATYADKTTWPLVPIPLNGMQKGQISNSLLSQLMTLWFNLGNNSSLGTLAVKDTLVTTAQASCGSNIPIGPSSKFGLPHNVVLYLNGSNGYSNTVNGLYQLANDVLGGANSDISALDAQISVAAINNAFNGCRVLTGTIDAATPMPSVNRNPNESSILAELKPNVIVFPNPTTGSFYIKITNNDSREKIKIQVIDLYGRLVNNQEVNAGQQIKLGETFRTGIYYVRIMQGAERKDIKLVKLSR